jgi:HAD superfamily hydrolase (TIGR01549 family)
MTYAVSTSHLASVQRLAFHDVRAVIFDVDGTLADSGKLGYDATLEILAKYNISPITYEEYCRCTRYTTPERLARHAGLNPEDEEFKKLGNQLACEFDDLYIGLVSKETAAFFPGILELIRSLPETVKVGALTNAACRYAHAVLHANSDKVNNSKFKLYQRFDIVLGADNVPRPKPHADGLLLACEKLQVDSASCVYIGDSPTDGLAAEAAGMPAIGVTWGAHDRETLASVPHFSHICSTVEELLELLIKD